MTSMKRVLSIVLTCLLLVGNIATVFAGSRGEWEESLVEGSSSTGDFSLLPRWFASAEDQVSSADLSSALNATAFSPVVGARVSVPVGMMTFSSTEVGGALLEQPHAIHSATLEEWSAIPFHRSYTGVGDAFLIRAVDASGQAVDDFGVTPYTGMTFNELGQAITFSATRSTIKAVIHYEEQWLEEQDLSEDSLALFSYSAAEERWVKLLSLVDTENNELRVVFHTLNGEIFRLGARDVSAGRAADTIILDPENPVAYVGSPSSYQASEGPYNVTTALDIQTYLQNCGTFTVTVTHDDPNLPWDTHEQRRDFILGHPPAVALVIGYDSHSTVMSYGNGGVKTLYVDVGENAALATRVISNMTAVYNYAHGGGRFPYPYQWNMGRSVEYMVAVASGGSSIPIVRVEVGMLSLYANRDWIESDFALSSQRQIPTALAQALMEFLGVNSECSCGPDERLVNTPNDNYSDNKAAEELKQDIFADLTVRDEGYVQVDRTADDGRLLLATNPPMLLENTDLSDRPASHRYGEVVVPSYITSDGSIEIPLPVEQLYEQSVQVAVSGGVTQLVPLGPITATFPITSTDMDELLEFFDVFSTTMGIGTCQGLMTWLARYCAGREPLERYGVTSLDQLRPDNETFMRAVMWYQVYQLTEEFYLSNEVYVPSTLLSELELGLNRITAPTILSLVPHTDTVDCEDGEVPTGHTLFIVGIERMDGQDPVLLTVDPNDMERTIRVTLDLENEEWIYPDAPYRVEGPNGEMTWEWRGTEMYTVAPGDIPYPPLPGTAPNVHWLGIDTVTTTLAVDGSPNGYSSRRLRGAFLFYVSGYSSRRLRGTEQDACVAFPLASDGLVAPSLPGNLILPGGDQVLELRGASQGEIAAMTFFNDGNAITIQGSAGADTVNAVGVGQGLHQITVTTNMADQEWSTTLFQEVDAGRTNRIFGLQHTTLHTGETLGLEASPHSNMFSVDNSMGGDRTYDFILSTVGWSGHTNFEQEDMTVQAGHIQKITAWNWDFLHVSPIFAYDEDENGDSTVTLLQDLVRPTELVLGLPFYVSDTLTYLTPETVLSFDVMPATCGISATLYSLDGGAFQVYTMPFTLEGLADGAHTLEFYSVDGIGNVEPTNQVDLYLYSTPPEFTIQLSGDLGADGWYTPPVTISLVLTPTVLPIDPAQVQCKVNNQAWQAYGGPFAIAREGVNRVSCQVADLASFAAPVQSIDVPIRTSFPVPFQDLGDPTLDVSRRMDQYRDLLHTVSARPGNTVWAQTDGVCSGTPLDPGDFYLLPDPSLGVPPDLSPVCALTEALYLQGGGITVFQSVLTETTPVWEYADVTSMLESYLDWSDYTVVDEDTLRAFHGLDGTEILILPSVHVDQVARVIDRMGEDGLQYLADFVRQGGSIYAIGHSIRILEASSLISDVVDMENPIHAVDDVATVEVTQPDHPLTLNWLTSTVYLPVGDYKLEPNGVLTSIAVYSDTDQSGSAAMLYGRVGDGHLVLVNHHALVKSDPLWYPPFIDAILLAWSEPASLLAQPQQLYDPSVDHDLLPAWEAGVPLSGPIAIDWADQTTGTLESLTETVTAGFIVSPTENPNWDIYPQEDGTTLMVLRQISLSETLPVSLTQGRHNFPILVRTASITSLAEGDVVVAYGEAELKDGEGHSIHLRHVPIRVQSMAPPETVWHKRTMPEILYGMPSSGVDSEVVVGAANFHDTPAYMPVYTEVVPLLGPALDMSMQIPLTDTQHQTIWFKFAIRFDSAPLPDQARRPGQIFDLDNWDGHTVYTLTLPAGVQIQLPQDFGDGGCDSPFDHITCCPDGTAYGDVVKIIRTPTETLVVLPAILFTWHLNDLNAYEYQDPTIRYHLHITEFREREVRFAVNYDPHDEETLNDPHIAFLYQNASLWTILGEMPLHVTTPPRDLPTPPSFVGARVADLWGRTRLSPSPATRLHLIAPMPEEGVGKGSSMLNVTSILLADLDGDGIEEKLKTIPADQPVTACLYTVMQDWGRTQGKTGTVVLRIPWGLGYQVVPLGDSWEAASQSQHGYAVYSDTLSGYGEDWVRFQVNIPSWQSERITTCLQIQPYPNIPHEGYRTFFDGALYYYPFDLGSSSTYELETSYVQAAWAVAHNPMPSFNALPSKLGRMGEELYYSVTLEDENDPRYVKPYIHITTYGGGTYVSTTYLGDTIDGVLRDPILSFEDEVVIRIELGNGSGTDWTDILLDIPLPPGLEIEPYVPHLGEPGALNERPHLNLSTIADNGWAVYYYRLTATPAYTGTVGEFFEIPITVSGNNLPADMEIPPVRVAIVDGDGSAMDVRGIGDGLCTLHRFEDGFLPDEVRLADESQALALEAAWYESEEDASLAYTTLPTLLLQTVSDTLGLATMACLPDPADRLPADNGPYTLIFHGVVSPFLTTQSEMEIDLIPTVVLTNHFGHRQMYTATGPVLPIRGPVLSLDYTGIPSSFNVPSATIGATVINDGDAPSIDSVAGFTLPLSLVAVPASDKCHAPVVVGNSQVITCEVSDMIPGGRDDTSIAFTVYPNSTSRSDSNTLLGALRQDTAEVSSNLIISAFGQYVNAFTGRDESTVFSGVYVPYQAMLPLVFRNYQPPRPDLVVESVTYWPSEPQVEQSAVISITITNVGTVPSRDEFWVDLYLNPEGTPAVNVFWNQIAEWGIAWHVYDALAPGESIILTSEAFDDPERPGEIFSRWPGYFPIEGPVDTYVLVDSYGEAPYGSIYEENEGNNLLMTEISVTPSNRSYGLSRPGP